MPPVRDLQTLVQELGQAYAPQNQIIDQSLAAQQELAKANEAGLEAAKSQVFNQEIPQAAQNKGMYFSGFTPNEQAQYTASTYLPALAKLKASVEEARLSALGKKADINSNIYDKAIGIRENDLSAQRQFQAEQERRAYEAEQARVQRDFQASQAERDRQIQRASITSSSTKTAPPTKAEARFDLTQDVATFFSNIGGQGLAKRENEFITERQLLPRLQQAYPELSPEEIQDAVYTYRKNAFGQ